MSKINLILFSVILAMHACSSEEEIIPVETPHFIVNDADETMTFELTWKANGQQDGYNIVDLDLYLSDTLRMTKESFLNASFFASEADWRENPILMSSIGDRNTVERITPSTYKYVFDDPRKYLGFAIHGLADGGNNVTTDITIEYTIAVVHGEERKIFSGSVTYAPALKTKTVIYYVATVDINGLDNVYSFRQPDKPVRIVRASDFVTSNQIDVSPGGSRTRENDRLLARLDWSVNSNLPGYDYVNLDLYSGTNLSSGFTGRSGNPDAYEAINFATYNVDFSRELGFTFVENKNKVAGPLTINYTYTVYFADAPFKRFVYTSSFITSALAPGNTIIKSLKFTKQGNTVSIVVL